MTKLPKDKQNKLVAVLLCTALLLVAFHMLIISKQRAALDDYANRTDQTRDKLAKAEQWLRMAPVIRTQLNEARKQLESKQEEMAPTDKFKWFYDTVEKSLSRHHVKLEDISPRQPEVTEVGVLPKFPYMAAIFGVKVTSDFQDLGVFLSDFENDFPYMRVQNLKISPEGESSGGKENAPRAQSANSGRLAVSLRVVTLIKPTASL